MRIQSNQNPWRSSRSNASFRAGVFTGGMLALIPLVVSMLLLTRTQQQQLSSNIMVVPAAAADTSQKLPEYSSGAPPTMKLPPRTQKIILNIGSNIDPILPRKRDGPCTLTIAFEPIVPEQIPLHPQVRVVPAAVSNQASLSTMYLYNEKAVSSSLSRATNEALRYFQQTDHSTITKIVPVLTLTQVLRSIPTAVEILMLDTDLQGYDFTAVAAALPFPRRIPYLKTETTLDDDHYEPYIGTQNSLCRDWLPFLTAHGYHLVGTQVGGRRNVVPGFESTAQALQTCRRSSNNNNSYYKYKEVDALWSLDDIEEDHLDAFAFLTLSNRTKPPFSEQEYAACHNRDVA